MEKTAFTAHAFMCGFYHLCSYLADYDQDFYSVKLPETVALDGETRKVTSCNQMSEAAIKEAVENTRLLPKEEIKENAKVWDKLKKENAQLRAVINGQLISVPAGFYDPWIINCISEDQPVQIKEVVKLI